MHSRMRDRRSDRRRTGREEGEREKGERWGRGRGVKRCVLLIAVFNLEKSQLMTQMIGCEQRTQPTPGKKREAVQPVTVKSDTSI